VSCTKYIFLLVTIQIITLNVSAQNDSLQKFSPIKNPIFYKDSFPKEVNKPEIPNNKVVSEIKGLSNLNDSSKLSGLKKNLNTDSVQSKLKDKISIRKDSTLNKGTILNTSMPTRPSVFMA